METSHRYRLFAEYEARGNSAVYEQWCVGIAGDPDLLGLIEQLPPRKRQPNLVLAAARFLGVGEPPFAAFRDWLVAHWDAVCEVALGHSTQTNECGRAAVLLPILARLRGPLSLIETGASAGLCLYPDRFSYRYTNGDQVRTLDPPSGRSPVDLPCTVSGEPPLPEKLPTVVHRSGVDLNPLDIDNPEDTRWLEALIWPGQDERLERLRQAIALARFDPPHLITGDLNETIAEMVHTAPADTTVVVFGSAVLSYLDPDARLSFERTVGDLPCHWISNEGGGVVQSVVGRLPKPLNETRAQFVLTLDGAPLAYAGGHGQTLDWFGE